MNEKPLTALILAGRRQRENDPLARPGAAHKSLIEIEGAPLIARVFDAINETRRFDDIVVAAPEDVRGAFQEVAAARHVAVSFMNAAGSPSSTVSEAIAAAPEGEMLVTTSDHPLLEGAMIERFLNRIDRSRFAGAAACVEKSAYEAAFPDTRRTFVKFRDFVFSGANLFWFRVPAAAPLAAFWRRLEGNRKNPGKMALEIGLDICLLYLAGALSKNRALHRIAQKSGVQADLIALECPEAAIDVDKPEDIETVRSILQARAKI